MIKKPIIILTNDDGIKARGIKELYNALQNFGTIFVIAPFKPRSGASHSITIKDNLSFKKIKFNKIIGYAVNGTPADCIKLAIYKFKIKPALVISGINHGPNFGKFIHYSGTAGAAAEAAFLGIPSIAISYDDFDKNADFFLAKKIIKIITINILNKKIKIKKGIFWNINIPNTRNIKGIKILTKSLSNYKEKYQKIIRNDKIFYYWQVNDRLIKINSKKLFDDNALKNGFITITPISLDITDKREVLKLKKLKIEKLIRSEFNTTL